MQSPEIDPSAFNEEVMFREPEIHSVNKLHEDVLEPLLWEWGNFMGKNGLL